MVRKRPSPSCIGSLGITSTSSVEWRRNSTYKVVVEVQAEMAVLHDSSCRCGVPGGRHNQIKLIEEEEESEGSSRVRESGPV